VVSPFVFSYEEQNLLFEGKIRDVKNRIMEAVESQKNKDIVIIGGAADLFEGASINIDAIELIKEMDAYIMMVELWRGDSTMDALIGAYKLFGLFGNRFIGGVINKVPQNAAAHIREKMRPFLEKNGIAIFGVFPKDSLLESIAIRQLVEILNGRVLCCEDRLDDFVENFSIGAMDVDSALSYFSRIPNKAVITGAHRSDIQLAAMETSTKCIILTGGLYTNDVVIGKAQSKGIPIISVAEDTFTAIDRIEATMGKARIREKGKIARAKELIETEFDMKRFLKTVKSNP
jgi:BioD-like phosphotransacetylase family protein